jgi:hypothetical protein
MVFSGAMKMITARWTYTNPRGLTKWYGHVDYYGNYVIGQWFSLDADTGSEYWSRDIFRANTVFGVAHDVIVASETRSDGPWTVDFGIYGIDARTGELRWSSHGRGWWGRVLRLLDYVPGFTNELRDTPRKLTGDCIITFKGRTLDFQTGRDRSRVQAQHETNMGGDSPNLMLNLGQEVQVDGGTIKVERGEDVTFLCLKPNGEVRWSFSAKSHMLFTSSYRLHADRIYLILGDAPDHVPVNPTKPSVVKPNPTNYQLGILDIASGRLTLCPLVGARDRTKCRIESIEKNRLLVSCDGKELTEYEYEG